MEVGAFDEVAPGAFDGVRVIDLSRGIAGAMATMLLADLRADVVRVLAPGHDEVKEHPGYLCWSRNKRSVELELAREPDLAVARELIASADVCVLDRPMEELERHRLDAARLTAADPALLWAWLPPYGARGPWTDLPGEHALLAALSGVAFMQFSWEDVPVHLVTPQLHYGQAILAASAIASGLFERARSGRGQAVTVSGLHAVAAMQGAHVRSGELPRLPNRGARGNSPNYRLYRCADGEWLFLATLMPPHFLKALEALGLGDILEMEGVEGEFANVMKAGVAGRVRSRLEARFAEHDREYWLRVLHEHGVPRGPVGDRDAWFAGETVAANEMRVELRCEKRGAIEIPGVPVRLSETPGSVRHLVAATTPAGVLAETNGRPRPTPAGAEPRRPLAGVRVLDLGVIIAAPLASAVLADLGADVIKVEPIGGDSFRPYGLVFVGQNLGKRSVALDLKRPDGREAFFDLVRQSDVVCDNYRLGVLERLGIGYDVLKVVNPRIVQASVTAYGTSGPLAADPGFDPLMQARGGMMRAQGGEDEPVFHQIALNDVASAMVTAFGVVAALCARERSGRGQRVETSLASQSVLCQSGELSRYAGRPPNPPGGRDCTGVGALQRFYACSDGWLMLWCTEAAHFEHVSRALGREEWVERWTAEKSLEEPRDGALADAIAAALSTRARDDSVELLRARGVPVAPAATRAEIYASPLFLENDLFTELDDPTFDRVTAARALTAWSRSSSGFQRSAPALGEHTEEVLAECGFSPERIQQLISSGAARSLASRP